MTNISTVLTHFQIEIFIFMVGQLSTRTSGELVERAWVVVQQTFEYYDELFDFSLKAHVALAVRVMQAWKVREKILRERNGSPTQPPAYIVRLEGLMATHESKYNTPSNSVSTVTDSQSTPGTSSTKAEEVSDAAPWDQMLGFIDTGSMNWDSFSGDWQSQIPAYPGFGQSIGGYNGNWM